jgi:type II secretory pathway component PulL
MDDVARWLRVDDQASEVCKQSIAFLFDQRGMQNVAMSFQAVRYLVQHLCGVGLSH